MYSIKELCEKSGISQASFYRMREKEPEFASLLNENKGKQGNKTVYAEPVLQWLLSRKNTTPEPTEKPQETAVNAPVTASGDALINAYREQIATLQAEIERLRQELDNAAAEKRQLIEQNGIALLTLQQEKQEKQKLLPEPKKPLLERIKTLFHKN